MTTTPPPSLLRVWTRLVRAHDRARGAVEAALKGAGLPSLEGYDVLVELERAGPLRPRDLQGRLLLAQYNLSRLLERMAAAGLVERQPCPEDRRGQVVAVTAAGLEMRCRMWPLYAGALGAVLGGRLTEEEAEDLARLLDRLIPAGA